MKSLCAMMLPVFAPPCFTAAHICNSLMFFYPNKKVLSSKWECYFIFWFSIVTYNEHHHFKCCWLHCFSCNWVFTMCVTFTVRGKNFYYIVVCVYWYKNQRMNATVLRYWLPIIHNRHRCLNRSQIVIGVISIACIR